MKLQTLKGFRDFLPQDAIKRNFLRDKIRAVFERWGYDPLETPTLEYAEVFEGVIGEDEKLFFKFEDTGGRKVALRYDQTVPASRVVGQYVSEIPMPFKRYQIQPAFRAEKPQKGRYREFLQCDADIWGIPGPAADAEVIALSLDIYKQLGFKKAIAKVNDRKLLRDYPYEAISAIDKLQKIGPDGVIAEMVSKGISQTQAKQYLENITTLKPNETIIQIFEMLDKLGVEKGWYEFDPTIARSFAYSDGPIWEIVIPEYPVGSVLGGERYDSLTKKLSGRDVPGTGFGLGFDRTLEAMEAVGLFPELKTVTKVLVTVFSTDLLAKSLELTLRLRSEGINTEVWLDENSKLEKQFKYANSKGIPYLVIIGPDEAAKDQVTLKDLSSGTQETLSLVDLLQKLT
ncbi:histidine--tRNA ligase [Candidatus Daviesbacteria bacterium RIFCSPHIGHO2_01_FULL_44_29]|uniref:Histidine--tRNA ligase n=1 Tax=Candidatus Daviesbacteria bacterium RIFCSPHIGHO2_02_FULL_43_12 TaxID=1797776 RepID=A0A1F5KH81_9BACT|nr:MAG: histidine--tRNA ligase [Candidatus Daviesbacteria bacterium RIFCSPHIGHO2_01_FULL_44_29]OGE39297.1 MAG: histidine--tRNA ligase [Candidatus Daviesbacteria bacterium RIFCSPHIGHO2_12_FULL_47_45]OGE40272.1 MAG: histidine--tRNA ligase [Candidatus Daviesbacteria bacterium RIFCSPHIGHO2_02_FULL_43_12]OGE69071.1 MAG: histidine--tRNA ligase [Candidatus Daviesbacteria bacterium RIFCSPLOWO2_01_FULL_43_15]